MPQRPTAHGLRTATDRAGWTHYRSTKGFHRGNSDVRSGDPPVRRSGPSRRVPARPAGSGRRVHGARRALGVRQEHLAAHARRARACDDGYILIGERDVTTLPPKDRDIAMVFQNYALYPHMTVPRTSASRCKLQVPKAEIDERVKRGRTLLDLDRASRPQAGRLRRSAPARGDGPGDRAPAAGVLMDEPLSNLDAKLRVQTRAQIAATAAPVRGHDRLRHARPGRGDDDGRSRRRDEGRRVAAVSTRPSTCSAGRPTPSSPASSGHRR